MDGLYGKIHLQMDDLGVPIYGSTQNQRDTWGLDFYGILWCFIVGIYWCWRNSWDIIGGVLIGIQPLTKINIYLEYGPIP